MVKLEYEGSRLLEKVQLKGEILVEVAGSPIVEIVTLELVPQLELFLEAGPRFEEGPFVFLILRVKPEGRLEILFGPGKTPLPEMDSSQPEMDIGVQGLLFQNLSVESQSRGIIPLPGGDFGQAGLGLAVPRIKPEDFGISRLGRLEIVLPGLNPCPENEQVGILRMGKGQVIKNAQSFVPLSGKCH